MAGKILPAICHKKGREKKSRRDESSEVLANNDVILWGEKWGRSLRLTVEKTLWKLWDWSGRSLSRQLGGKTDRKTDIKSDRMQTNFKVFPQPSNLLTDLHLKFNRQIDKPTPH
jgi:hypothetical protein